MSRKTVRRQSYRAFVDRARAAYVLAALGAAGGSYAEAARIAGVTQGALNGIFRRLAERGTFADVAGR